MSCVWRQFARHPIRVVQVSEKLTWQMCITCVILEHHSQQPGSKFRGVSQGFVCRDVDVLVHIRMVQAVCAYDWCATLQLQLHECCG